MKKVYLKIYLPTILVLFSASFSNAQTHYSLSFVETESDYAYISSSTVWNFGTDDFMIFVRYKSTEASTRVFLGKYQSSSNNWVVGAVPAGKRIYFQAIIGSDNITTWSIQDTYSFDGEWHSVLFFIDNDGVGGEGTWIDGVNDTETIPYDVAVGLDLDNSAEIDIAENNTQFCDIQISKIALWKSPSGMDSATVNSFADDLHFSNDDGLDFRQDYGDYTYSKYLVAYYEFNEGSGTTINDLVGSEDFTISGASWSSDAPEFTRTPAEDEQPGFDLFGIFKGYTKW